MPLHRYRHPLAGPWPAVAELCAMLLIAGVALAVAAAILAASADLTGNSALGAIVVVALLAIFWAVAVCRAWLGPLPRYPLQHPRRGVADGDEGAHG